MFTIANRKISFTVLSFSKLIQHNFTRFVDMDILVISSWFGGIPVLLYILYFTTVTLLLYVTGFFNTYSADIVSEYPLMCGIKSS